MTERWLALVADPEAAGATDELLASAAAQLDVNLPGDYMAVMKQTNGGQTEFGDSWIRLWRVEDLVGYAAGFTFFGSDGGGEAYAWDFRTGYKPRYVVIPFIVPDPELPCHAVRPSRSS